MRRLWNIWSTLDPQRKSNLIAGGVVLAAIGFLRLEAAPIPAGSEFSLTAANKTHGFQLALKPVLPTATASAGTDSVASTAPLSAADLAKQTLQRKLALVNTGIEFLRKMPDYTAQFVKQESVGGQLSNEQEIFMKVRHEPFSVYLKWLTEERGQEALYVDSENDGEMLVRSAGWKSKLGTLSLPPDGSIAMSKARYPITRAGMLELALMIKEYHEQDLAVGNFNRCEQLADQDFDGRSCAGFLLEYKDTAGSPLYRKSVTLIDKEWSIPVYIKNYTWPEPDQAALVDAALDEATLIEAYSYSDIKFRLQLANSDFDRNNEEYRLH